MRNVIAVTLALSLVVGCQDKSKQAPPAPASAVPPASASATLAQLPAVPASPTVPAAPEGLPPAAEPADGATISADRVALGWALFFDKRISKDGSMSCESCHHPDAGWATHSALDAKVGGAKNKRNAPTVQNLAYHKLFYWDGRMPTLEVVCGAAWKGQLGADLAVTQRLNEIPGYKTRFMRAFGAEASPENVPKALGAFLFALKNGNSAFDKLQKGDKSAMSAEAQHGYKLFAASGCTNCHQPPLFTDGAFHNVGIGMDKPEADRDKGRTDATKDAADEGKFKTPSLRDVAKTAPYFHDGSAATLEDAIQLVTAGGAKNAKLDPALKPHNLSDKDRADLKAFLESLSGTATFNGPPPEMP